MHMRLVFVDLPEDRGFVTDRFCSPTEQPRRGACRLLGKRDFRTRQNADRNGRIFRRGKAAGAKPKVAGGELVADLGRTRLHIV